MDDVLILEAGRGMVLLPKAFVLEDAIANLSTHYHSYQENQTRMLVPAQPKSITIKRQSFSGSGPAYWYYHGSYLNKVTFPGLSI